MTTNPDVPGDESIRRRVLLVEDNQAASWGLARVLEARGFDVTVRNDGSSALRALESEQPPDFVLTDLLLPDLDGREVARFARSLVPAPRIALITGWDLDDDLQDPQSLGIDWIFPKPVDVHRLIAQLRESLPK